MVIRVNLLNKWYLCAAKKIVKFVKFVVVKNLRSR
jgi:hypothetical protein